MTDKREGVLKTNIQIKEDVKLNTSCSKNGFLHSVTGNLHRIVEHVSRRKRGIMLSFMFNHYLTRFVSVFVVSAQVIGKSQKPVQTAQCFSCLLSTACPTNLLALGLVDNASRPNLFEVTLEMCTSSVLHSQLSSAFMFTCLH